MPSMARGGVRFFAKMESAQIVRLAKPGSEGRATPSAPSAHRFDRDRHLSHSRFDFRLGKARKP